MKRTIWPFFGAILILAVACSDEEALPQQSPDISSTPAPSTETAASSTTEPATTGEPTPSPAEGWVRYAHPTFGYSFDYPSDWHLYPPNAPSAPIAGVALYSYDLASVAPGQAGQPVPKEHLKVLFWVQAGVTVPLADWLTQTNEQAVFPPTLLQENTLELDGRPAVKRFTQEAEGRKHLNYYADLDDSRIFVVNAFPGDSDLIGVFEEVVQSLKFGR